MCKRYATKMLLCDYPDIAKKYLTLALVYDESIKNDPQYKEIMTIANSNEYKSEITEFCRNNTTERNVSYDPPEESYTIDLK